MTAAMLPMLILMIGTILSSGQADAKQIKKSARNQELTFTQNQDQYTCSGSIIRNRNNMLLFYDQNSKQTILTPYSNVMKNVANLR